MIFSKEGSATPPSPRVKNSNFFQKVDFCKSWKTLNILQKYFQNIPRTLHTKFHEDIFKIDEEIKLFPTLEKEKEKKEEKKKTLSDEDSPRKNLKK